MQRRGDRLNAAVAGEDERGDERDERHQPQRPGVAGGEAQVGNDRPGAGGEPAHAREVGGPDRLGGGIVAAERRRVAQGGERPAGQRRVDPVARLGGARPAEAVDAEHKERDEPDAGGGEDCDELAARDGLGEAESERRPEDGEGGAERPEGAGE